MINAYYHYISSTDNNFSSERSLAGRWFSPWTNDLRNEIKAAITERIAIILNNTAIDLTCPPYIHRALQVQASTAFLKAVHVGPLREEKPSATPVNSHLLLPLRPAVNIALSMGVLCGKGLAMRYLWRPVICPLGCR